MVPRQSRVVIVGAGYAGLRTARDLARTVGKDVEIVLINGTPYHVDVTSFYEVATAYLKHESQESSEHIAQSVQVPLADILKRLPVRLIIGTVTHIDTNNRTVTLRNQSVVSYDTLVIALGTEVATFGIPGVAEHAFSIKTLSESLALRHHIVRQFHMAAGLPPAERRAALTFVVVGGGASGVETVTELVGHIKQQCHHVGLDPQETKVILAEAGPTILKTVPERLQQEALHRLQALHIEVMAGQAVTQVEPDRVTFKNGQGIPTRTVVWAGGLKVHPVLAMSNLPLERWGVAVMPTLQVIGHPNIFVVGDAAVIKDSLTPIPATVAIAYTQGSLVATNIKRQLAGQPLQAFQPHVLGAFVSLGGKWAVVNIKDRWGYHGWIPWFGKQLTLLRYWLNYLPWWRAWMFWSRSELMKTHND